MNFATGAPVDQKPKRKHRATGGKPPGGARAGAGRPVGATNALEMGAVNAIQTFRHRVPESASREAAAVADEAMGAIIQVMRGEVMFGATDRLRAATMVRQEVCGPIAQKVEHGGPDGGPLQVSIEIVRTVRP